METTNDDAAESAWESYRDSLIAEGHDRRQLRKRDFMAGWQESKQSFGTFSTNELMDDMKAATGFVWANNRLPNIFKSGLSDAQIRHALDGLVTSAFLRGLWNEHHRAKLKREMGDSQ